MKRNRKILTLILGILFAVVLSGCQSEAAKAMDEQIRAIGEVTLDSLEVIESAERAYSSMESADQKQVRAYGELEEARTAYSKLKANEVDRIIGDIGQVTLNSGNSIKAAEDAYSGLSSDEQQYVEQYEVLVSARNDYSKLRADQVIATINGIGKVTILSSDKISTAEKSYNALTDDEKTLVTNYFILESARNEYDKCCAEDVDRRIEEAINDTSKIDSAETAYKALTSTQKNLVTKYDKLIDAKIAFVIATIDNLYPITLDSSDAIKAAEKAYNKLSTTEKSRVTNSSKISEAKTELKELEQKKKEEEKKELLKKVRQSSDEVNGITWYNSTSRPRYMNSRSFLFPYIGVWDLGYIRIRLIYDYAGDDWIFFTKAIIVTDEMRYTRSFDYFDVERETAVWNKLCEYIDVAADKDDLAMLRDIATSEKVTIRLQGDSRYSDFTVSDSDKQAISDLLKLYDFLSEEDGIVPLSG